MKTIAVLCLLFFVSLVQSKEVNQESVAPNKSCQKPEGENVNQGRFKQCLAGQVSDVQTSMEKITIHGEYIGIESSGVNGSFHLDGEFIDAMPKTTGDINDLIALLPGVQVSEDANSISNLGEISAGQLSISGARPWQTGFYIDGMNYNNVMDPASDIRTSASQNDVSGGVQTMNINSQMVSTITVFDNNIPAQYGGFSGGLIQVDTVDPFKDSPSHLSLGYRGNRSDWGNYHIIYPATDDERVDIIDSNFNQPEFEKNSYNLLLSKKLNDNHGIVASLNYTTSVISDVSLSELKTEQRSNLNALFKYSYRKGWVDFLDATILYSPYNSDDYLKDVLNSDYTLDGGAVGSTIKLEHDFNAFTLSSNFNANISEQSRTAPAHYYQWIVARGKEWGSLASNLATDAFITSNEGGYGNLDNTQTTLNWKTQLEFNDTELFGISHSALIGVELQDRQAQRTRKQDHYNYYAPVSADINCSGYTLDCVELSYFQSIESLTEQLGGEIDFSNAQHIQAYSDNIATTPQYFRYRLLTPQEDIKASLFNASLFASDSFNLDNASITLGLRLERDSLYNNTNLAPRISLGYDLFDDGNSLLILGANRYFDSGLINDKIKEQQLPSYLQQRISVNGNLQGWLDYNASSRFKYLYTDLKTPFDDEWVMGWKQATNSMGNFSLKYVKRWKRDQLARNDSTLDLDDGYRYISMNNDATGNSERVSFAWNAYFAGHSVWFNASYSKTYLSNESYEDVTQEVPIDELVYLEDEIISSNQLDVIRSNFARPVVYNLGWSYDWNDNVSTSLSAMHKGAYSAAELSTETRLTGDLSQDCDLCEAVFVSLPVYQEVSRKATTFVAFSSQWNIPLAPSHNIELRADITNLFNQRTYNINESIGQSGLEPGRTFWLELKYIHE